MLAALTALGAIAYFVPNKRRLEIQGILSDLESMKLDVAYREGVALNIEFFRAIRFPFTYIWWLIFKAPKLRRNRARIAEIGDLPFPKWQKALLEELSSFEAWMPQMLQPIKQGIIQELDRLSNTSSEPIVVLNIGCGGMELERQIIYQLLRTRFNTPVVFVGVDYSSAIPTLIASRLAPLVSRGLLQLQTTSHLGANDLAKLKAQATSSRFSVVFLQANVFDLRELPENSFSLVYHTRLRHHLTPEESARIDKLAIHLAPKVIELDDLFSIRGIILASIFAWRFPAALTGGILSYLRDFSKKELLLEQKIIRDWKIKFYSHPIWCHLKIYDKANAHS